MLLVLTALAVAAPLKTLDVPVERETSAVPVAAQQRYLARAVRDAVDQLDLERLDGRTLRLTVSGVLQMSDEDLGEYVRSELVSAVSHAGGRVREEDDDELLVRVTQAGIDHVLESRNVDVPRRKALPIALMAGGSGLATLAAALWAGHADNGQTTGPAIGVGAVTAGVGVGLLFLPPKHAQVQCDVYRARVSLESTFIPAKGKSWDASGDADVLVEDDGLPCEAEAEARRRRRD